jgi:hypothetical protein
MNLPWLKMILRVAAAISLAVAAIKFAFGGVSLHTQEQATSTRFTIDRVVEFGSSSIIMPVVAFLLFTLSFVVPTKDV